MGEQIRLIQFVHTNGSPGVAKVEGDAVRPLLATSSVYELANAAILSNVGIAELANGRASNSPISYDVLIAEHRLRPPVHHPSSQANFLLTGTGLTHIGSASTRDAMHEGGEAAEGQKSDPMRLFELGLQGGKPSVGEIGAMPEWFYKGDGGCVVPPGMSFASPNFARACAEEPEIVGIYLNGADGTPWRIGYTLGNDLSDHETERLNFMYVAPSKLRECSLGPELFIGELPERVEGVSRIRRDGKIVWEGPFESGEANMSYSIGNLEHHHFRYPLFRRPGDLHAHFFGCPVMSFADGFRTFDGDVFEFDVPIFGRPLVNPLRFEAGVPEFCKVRAL